MKRWHMWGLAGLALVAVVFFPEVILPLCYYVLFGWAGFLWRVVPEIRWDPLGLTVGIGAFCGLVVGGHLLIRSFLRQTADLVTFPDDLLLEAHVPSATDSACAVPSEYVVLETQAPNWTTRNTLLAVALIVLFCTLSISATAAAHATLWFVRSDPPTWYIGNRFMEYHLPREHLRKLGKALSAHDDSMSTLPAGGTFRIDGTPGHSWMTSLLPFMDHEGLFLQMRSSEPWNSPHNAPLARTQVTEFSTPGPYETLSSEGYALADFAANQHVMGFNHSIGLSRITDGTSQTMLAGQVKDLRRPWADPRNFRDPVRGGINKSPNGFGSRHKDGATILYADGHVGFLNIDIDPQVLKAISTPNGGERMDDH